MSLAGVLAIVGERGLTLQLGGDGGPQLKGDRSEATPALLEALRAYRAEIIAHLGGRTEPMREWRFPPGQLCREDPSWGWPLSHHAAGAWWWRFQGEKDWKAVPGRPGEGQPCEAKTSS